MNSSIDSRFPGLNRKIGWMQLATTPTEVHHLSSLEHALKKENLLVKRDDTTGKLYGGNKVRKLEYILGEARTVGAKRLITIGGAGSNHALATAIYGKSAGFDVTLLLFAQPNSPAVRQNLLEDYCSGATIIHFETFKELQDSLRQIVKSYTETENVEPYLVAAGGSSVRGVIGYVNAGLELCDQIAKGVIPEPEAIYCPFGTMGTAAGLVLGTQIGGLHTKIVGVRVVPDYVADYQKFFSLVQNCSTFLKEAGAHIPPIDLSETRFTVRDEFFGEGYGIPTEKSKEAAAIAKEDGLTLELTYTAKAFSAFLEEAKKLDAPLLFWNTKSSASLVNKNCDYKNLPSSFHSYFDGARSDI